MRDAHLAENIFQTRSSNNFKRRQEIRLISYIKGTVACCDRESWNWLPDKSAVKSS